SRERIAHDVDDTRLRKIANDAVCIDADCRAVADIVHTFGRLDVVIFPCRERRSEESLDDLPAEIWRLSQHVDERGNTLRFVELDVRILELRPVPLAQQSLELLVDDSFIE